MRKEEGSGQVGRYLSIIDGAPDAGTGCNGGELHVFEGICKLTVFRSLKRTSSRTGRDMDKWILGNLNLLSIMHPLHRIWELDNSGIPSQEVRKLPGSLSISFRCCYSTTLNIYIRRGS
jgi:hypothetical protein